MKTLYISDLDGTLLNSGAEISEFTQDTLSKLLLQGLNFTIATARTAATAIQILNKLNIHVPIILMNGVCVYDICKGSYVKIEPLEKTSCSNFFNVLEKYNLSGFLYSIDDNKLSTFYENTNTPNARGFIEERTKKFGKIFTKVVSFMTCLNSSLVYFSVSDKKEKLEPAYNELITDKNIHLEFYRDIYTENYWYLEICSINASKSNAVNFLRDKYEYDETISFGDNLNDISMFLASDESYAVANAKQEVKERATGVIESNDDDGVAKFILKANL